MICVSTYYELHGNWVYVFVLCVIVVCVFCVFVCMNVCVLCVILVYVVCVCVSVCVFFPERTLVRVLDDLRSRTVRVYIFLCRTPILAKSGDFFFLAHFFFFFGTFGRMKVTDLSVRRSRRTRIVSCRANMRRHMRRHIRVVHQHSTGNEPQG